MMEATHNDSPNIMDMLFGIVLGVIQGDKTLSGKFYPHKRENTLTVTAPNKRDDFRFQLNHREGTVVATCFMYGKAHNYNLKSPDDVEKLEKSIATTLHALLLYGPPKKS